MSVFIVRLQNTEQGTLDRNAVTGAQMNPSKQRTVYVMGPNRINRLLADGETFTDCNYWKRFAYPQVPLDEAFIYVETDDNSVYSDVPEENVYPKVYSKTCAAGSGYAANTADILGDTGSYASFCQITNTHASQDVTIRLNGLSGAVFTLQANTAQVFNTGDLTVSKVEIANPTSGGDAVLVEIICSVRTQINS